MEDYNKLWSEFCHSGSIMSYLSYKQLQTSANNSELPKQTVEN